MSEMKFKKFNAKRAERILRKRLPGLLKQLADLEKARRVSPETMRLTITI